MRVWRHLLGGMLLWTAHFFAAYGIASVFPGTPLADVLVLIVTLLALAVAGLLFTAMLRGVRGESDSLERWTYKGGAVGYALAGIAIVYQGLPAVIT